MKGLLKWLLAFGLGATCQVHFAQSDGFVSRPAVLDFEMGARSAGAAGSMEAVLDPSLGDVLGQGVLLDSTHAGQLHLAFVDYFAGITAGSAVTAFHAPALGLSWHTGARYLSLGTFAETSTTGAALGEFSGGEIAWVSGATYAVDSAWTVGVNLALGQSHLYSRSTLFGQGEIALSHTNKVRKLRLTAAVRPWGASTSSDETVAAGRFEPDARFALSKGFDNAPFVVHVAYENMQTWDLSPAGIYDDNIDPLTGDTLVNSTWATGDRLLRHLRMGTEIKLSENLRFRVGYDHRRRSELKLSGAPGTAGFSWGLGYKTQRFVFEFGRATYHAAGASNHVAIRTQLSGR